MFSDTYHPNDTSTLALNNVKPLDLTVLIIGARHLMGSKSKRGLVSPFVEIEIVGSDYDCQKMKTRVVNDNGLNPVWDESFNIRIQNPPMALFRLSVYDEDMFGEPNFLGAATYPCTCILSGYRAVPLNNGHSEELELSSLLVKVGSPKNLIRKTKPNVFNSPFFHWRGRGTLCTKFAHFCFIFYPYFYLVSKIGTV